VGLFLFHKITIDFYTVVSYTTIYKTVSEEMNMSKSEFIKKLRRELSKYFNMDEITDILADYEDFFEAGAELSNPTSIAIELAEAHDKKRVWLPSLLVSYIENTVLVIALSYLAFIAFTGSGYFVYNAFFIFIAFALVLWRILGGTWRKAPPASRVKGRRAKWILLAGHLVLPILVGFSQFYIFDVLQHLYDGSGIFSYSSDIEILARTLNLILLGSFVISILMAAGCVILFYRRATHFFALFIHSIAASLYFALVYEMTNNLQDTSLVTRILGNYLFIYVASFTVSLIAAVLIAIIAGKEVAK